VALEARQAEAGHVLQEEAEPLLVAGRGAAAPSGSLQAHQRDYLVAKTEAKGGWLG
jgi:hypothetical protein